MVSYRAPALKKRLDYKTIASIVQRHGAGESARSLAKEFGVAATALTRLLRTQGATIRRQRVSEVMERRLAEEYEASATMCELEAKHGLSHGAVLRSLKRSGVKMRTRASRTR